MAREQDKFRDIFTRTATKYSSFNFTVEDMELWSFSGKDAFYNCVLLLLYCVFIFLEMCAQAGWPGEYAKYRIPSSTTGSSPFVTPPLSRFGEFRGNSPFSIPPHVVGHPPLVAILPQPPPAGAGEVNRRVEFVPPSSYQGN